jgi:hypothetical protein
LVLDLTNWNISMRCSGRVTWDDLASSVRASISQGVVDRRSGGVAARGDEQLDRLKRTGKDPISSGDP